MSSYIVLNDTISLVCVLVIFFCDLLLSKALFKEKYMSDNLKYYNNKNN
jgi:hypothetical protein